jgi:hypothetical protein
MPRKTSLLLLRSCKNLSSTYGIALKGFRRDNEICRFVGGSNYSMGLFRAWLLYKAFKKPTKKTTDDSIPPVQKAFLDQFPTWAIRHSQKLTHELTGITLDGKEKEILIDCLTGAHVVFLNFSLDQDGIEFFGDADKIVAATKTWPTRALEFFVEASKFIRRELEQALKSEKEGEPPAVYLAIETTRFIKNGSKEFSPSPLVLVALRDLFHRLHKELLDWLCKLLDPDKKMQ